MLTPKETFEKSVSVGVNKASLSWWRMVLLGLFAGMFIALAGVGSTFANIYGGKLAGALVFTVGLAMVVVAGSELFTGNNLMVMALFNRKISLCRLLKNWFFVFIGNFIGALFVATAVSVSGLFDPIAETVVNTSVNKVGMGFFEAMVRGVFCNILVCVAVWMAFTSDTVGGKIIALAMPVMLFVLCGFEHSVANMFYIPAGMVTGAINGLPAPTIQGFIFGNLLPVTIGNIIGGACIVGGGYYLALAERPKKKKGKKNEK